MLRPAIAAAVCAFIGIGMTIRTSPATSRRDDEDGRWNGEGTAYLHLTDGAVQGSDGCNGVHGTYEREGDEMTFRLGLSTLRGCPGVDTWLRNIATARIAGDALIISNKTGEEIGVLRRPHA